MPEFDFERFKGLVIRFDDQDPEVRINAFLEVMKQIDDTHACFPIVAELAYSTGEDALMLKEARGTMKQLETANRESSEENKRAARATCKQHGWRRR